MKRFQFRHAKTAMMAACATLAIQPDIAAAQQRAAQVAYQIAGGDLGTALTELARQSNREIYFSAELTRGKKAPRLRGRMSIEEALSRLLAGSGLRHRVNASGSIVVERADAAGNGAISSDDADAGDAGRAEILVVGSRSLNADIRRTEDDDQPYVVFGKEEIRASQAVNAEEFLRTRLPQNAGFLGSNAQTPNGSAFSTFNLRGLGVNQTLILVNGRRIAERSGANAGGTQPDINGIPLASIERIEVLPSSAGGIYGGNAVGGVINIVLRSDYRGLEATATYNDTFDFKVGNARLDLVGGLALEGGRTNITFSASASRSGTLRVRDREALVRDGLALGYRNRSPLTNGTTPVGNGVNIRSTTGANLVLDPQYGGRNLGSAITNVALGYAGVGSDNGAALIAGAGAFNLDVADDVAGLKRGILVSSEIESLNVGVRRKFADWLDVFADYSLTQNRGTTYSVSQLPTSVTLAAAAPTNPFQQQVTVTFPSNNYAFPASRDSRTHRLNLGSIIRLPWKWAVNLEFNKSWSRANSVGYTYVVDTFLTSCGFQASSAAACAGKPVINPLQAPLDYGSYLFDAPTARTGPYGSEFENPVLRASGPLFKLAGGNATLTLALQREASYIKRTQDVTLNQTTRVTTYTKFSSRFQRTNSAYAELALPLVSAAQDIPLIRELELRGAIRHDDYLTESPPLSAYSVTSTDPDAPFATYKALESRFKSTNFTVAGRWSPLEGVVLRGSYASGFLPPSAIQLANTTLVLPQTTPDPFRGNLAEGYSVNRIIGLGNTSLTPETSRSLAVGVILTPVQGLRLSADYTRIKKKNEIGSLPIAYLLANPDQFPGRVVRNPAPQPGDPAGFLGRIQTIDVSNVNLYRSLYQSVDFQADYTFDVPGAGQLRVYALASWQPDSIRQTVVQAAPLNYVGNRDGSLEWQGNGGLDWIFGNLSVQWNAQYYNAYRVYNTVDPRTTAGAAAIASAIQLQGAGQIPNQMYHDLYASYDFRGSTGLLSGVRISAGIQNLFDKKPPVVAITSYNSLGYSGYGDPRLRRFTLSLRKAFGSK